MNASRVDSKDVEKIRVEVENTVEFVRNSLNQKLSSTIPTNSDSTSIEYNKETSETDDDDDDDEL